VSTSVNRLAASIGYPETVPEDATSFAFAVDGGEVLARETGGRLVLSRVLWRESEADQGIVRHIRRDSGTDR